MALRPAQHVVVVRGINTLMMAVSILDVVISVSKLDALHTILVVQQLILISHIPQNHSIVGPARRKEVLVGAAADAVDPTLLMLAFRMARQDLPLVSLDLQGI